MINGRGTCLSTVVAMFNFGRVFLYLVALDFLGWECIGPPLSVAMVNGGQFDQLWLETIIAAYG